MRNQLDANVFDAALDRLVRLYERGDRVVVNFSAGKDSACILELAILAATATNRLPVDVVLRDEEAMFPGTYEYAERVMRRPEVALRWLWAGQPMVNCFNRAQPYWWLFDPEVDQATWVRPLPEWAEKIEPQHIQAICSTDLFPVEQGQRLIGVTGLRVEESRMRAMGLHSSGGYLTRKANAWGAIYARPIYDWRDGDVWKAIGDNGWDYSSAYDAMLRAGLPAKKLRTGPPTINSYSIDLLRFASRIWPTWFDRLCKRCPGVRTAVQFGLRTTQPQRQRGETWQDVFFRECVGPKTPAWIKQRAEYVSSTVTRRHAAHSVGSPFPDVKTCLTCGPMGSWHGMALALYGGDPFAIRTSTFLNAVEPATFREGAKGWGGGSASW